MNTIVLYVEELKGANEMEMHGIKFKNSMFVRCLIDGDDIVDEPEFEGSLIYYDELIRSCQGSGKYLIFTCICGNAMDGGWEGIEVGHSADTIEWRFQAGEKTVHYSFDRSTYLREVESLSSPIRTGGLTLQPQRIVFPDDFEHELT